MRKYDKLVGVVQDEVIENNINGLQIFFSYETPVEVAYIEIYDNLTGKVIDSYTDDSMTIELISKDYPQFFKTNK